MTADLKKRIIAVMVREGDINKKAKEVSAILTAIDKEFYEATNSAYQEGFHRSELQYAGGKK